MTGLSLRRHAAVATRRQTLLLGLATVLLALGGIGALLAPAVGAPELPFGHTGPPAVPVLLGLAATGGADRRSAVERLATDLEVFLAELEADDRPRADDRRGADATFELERDDEVGRLSAAVEELATELRERERRFDARERELRATNARFGAIIEASPAAIVAVDLEGTVELWNPAAERIFGWSAEEVRGGPLPIVPEGRVDEVERFHARLEAGEQIAGYETERVTRDGSLIDVSLSKAPLRDADGEIVGVVAALEDITDRKETERRLRERERRLQAQSSFTNALLDAVDDVFYVIDADGGLQRWNETLPAITDYADGEIESMNALEFFAADDRATIADAIDEVLETGSARVEADVVPAAGEPIPFEFVASRLEDLEGNPVVTGIGRDISEQTERERQLRERERQLSTLMSNVPGMVYRARNEPDWPIEFASEGCLELTGYDPVAVEDGAVNWGDDVMVENDESVWEEIQAVLEAGEQFQFVYPIETADGERRWVSERGRGVDGDGSIEALEGVIIDVTERVENERKLERTTRLLEQSQRLTDVGAWELDVRDEPYELWWTDEVARIHGLDADGADVGLDEALSFYHPDDRPRMRAAIDAAIEDGEGYDHEVRLRTDDGETRWVRTIGEAVSEAGTVVKVHGSIQDVTERKRRERELERYETIIQAIGDPVYTLDATGEFQFVNDAIESVTGHEPDDLIGRDVREVLLPGDFERAQDLVRELLREGKPYETFEMGLETADGDVIEGENHMALLPMDDGEFAGTAGVVRDITERKERERDLERTTDLLERVQRMAKVGGWELDVDADPPTATWTEELYRLHDHPRDVAPTLESTVACYHPDDRPFVRRHLETAIATERRYEYEARLRTDAGERRWVHAIGEPIYDADGTLDAFRGSVQDVTDQKRRETALESLHETARELLNVESASAVADLVVETATDVLDAGGAGVYLLDAETNRFEPAAASPEFVDRAGGAPSVAVGDGDSVLWSTYVTGSQTVVDDADIGSRSPLFGGDVPGGLLVPIGDHGVFVLIAPPETIGDETRQLVETLVATTEAAFDRLESEASLRERDAELEARNRRLRRQMQVTEIIRGIDRSLIGADGREEIERTVPERLVEADDVAFAWIGDVDASETTLEVRSWAGTEPEYLDTVSLALEEGSDEPSVRTARTESPTVVENVVDGLKSESWRANALDAGFQSVVSVPLTFEEYSYGVLSIYADEPGAFTDLERTVVAELGEGIANAINGVRTQEALHAETLVELTLALEGDDDVLSRIAEKTGATVSYEGLGAHSRSETVLFFETSNAPPAEVRDALDDLVSVADARLITESDERCLFEATVTGDVLVSRLVRHGASPRSIVADGERTALVVDVHASTDVREFVDLLADRARRVDLESRRHVSRESHTRQELIASLLADLTDRQLEVLRTAYLAGFFEWPRESTGEEIAEMLEVTQPTVNRHLRIGQQRLLAQLFETDALSLVDG